MIMNFIRLLVTGLLVLGSTSCAGRLFSSTPPAYFEVNYPFQAVDCGGSIRARVRVWPFSASPPFDRDQMIVLSPSRQVHFSSRYRWISPPGDMVSDRILRDMAMDNLFTKVFAAVNPSRASAEMSGHIFRFAVEDFGDRARVVLESEVTLYRDKPRAQILFKKHYVMAGTPTASPDPQYFAESASELVAELSARLRGDLCTMLKDSSFQDGD